MAAPSHALVVADGDVDTTTLAALMAAAERPRLIAADGGAARVLEAGLVPDLVVGDFDSLAEADLARLATAGVELRRAAPDKDESDMELGLLTALGEGATRITVLGALGLVRPEHSVANLLLLADPRLDGLDLALVGRGSRLSRSGTGSGPGEAVVEGEPGDYVSLFPLGDMVEGVTTHGLRFRLTDEALPLGPSRGLSNELLERRARVTSTRGRLLLIHTPRSMAEGPPTGDD
ncbi:MAG: thiamine diphosphokinase [Chloroflexota bacterium]|jgi:thiamine pyrophosphokinase